MNAFCGDQQWHAHQGDFVWLRRDIPHGYAVQGEQTLGTLAIAVPAGFDQIRPRRGRRGTGARLAAIIAAGRSQAARRWEPARPGTPRPAGAMTGCHARSCHLKRGLHPREPRTRYSGPAKIPGISANGWRLLHTQTP